jgi:hypothetical protein
MATYTIYFLDPRKVVVSFDFVEAESDAEAWTHVPRLLRFRTDSRNVEIYEGARRVTTPGAAANDADHDADVAAHTVD